MALQTTQQKSFLLKLLAYASLVILMASVAAAQCTAPGFNIGNRIFPNLSFSFPAAALDFNGDGNVDVALRTGISSSIPESKVAILFGDGMGGLSVSSEFSVGGSASSYVFGDLNNDGKPDMIINYFSAATSKTWWNNGAGVFVTSTDLINTLGKPLVVADVNGDGKGDVVCSNGNSFTVRLGDGAGSFTQGTPTFFAPGGAGLYGIMAGDFNNDTTIDLVGSYIRSNDGESKLVVYGGDGSGGFAASPVVVFTGNYVELTISSDFNSDNKPDLVGENLLSSAPDAVTVLLNNGAGGFSQTDYPTRQDTLQIRKGDFNGDGKQDIATETRSSADFYGTGINTILDGNGLGGFTRHDQLKSKAKIDVVADYNNDGKSDALTFYFESEFTPRSLRTMLGTCARRNISGVIDYDGDGITDYAVWRPTDGKWFINKSAGGLLIFPWGLPTDIPVPGDYDGDDKTDIAVYRPSNGGWYSISSSDNVMRGVQWGGPGDKPVQGDYDGDGKVDVAVFRPSTGGWYVRKSSDGGLLSTYFGIAEDKPVQSDYDGDNKTDVAVFRPSTGAWYVLRSSDNGFVAVGFGISSDTPVQGDYDGDGKSDFAVYRPSGGAWYVLRSLTGTFSASHYGISTDIPVPGDFNRRDGVVDITVRRDNSSNFYTYPSGIPVVWGASGDVPVSVPYHIE